MIDAEYALFFQEMQADSADFASVVRLHRNFLANIIKSSMIDNGVIQEGIENILHLCLRFLAICKLLLQESELDTAVIVVPPEEFDALHKEFTTQLVYLVHLMKRIESGKHMMLGMCNDYMYL